MQASALTTTYRSGTRTTDLIPILDRFLEAAANATKWRLLTPAFRVAVKDVGAVFSAQGDLLLKRAGAKAKESRGLPPLGAGLFSVREAALDQAGWLDAWDTVATETAPRLVEVIQTAAVAAMEIAAAELGRQLQVDTAFNLKNPRATQYMREHGAALVKGINQTTRDRLQTILTEGIDTGESYTQIAARIDMAFADFSRGSVTDILLDHTGWSRSETVAIQELSMAYEASNEIVAQDLQAGGLVMQKAWESVRDDRVDLDICQANQNQGWIDASQAFQSAHLTAPGHVLCRCTTLWRRKPRG